MWIHHEHKRRIASSDGSDTVIIKALLGDYHRVYDNDTAREVLALERQGISDFEAYRAIVSGAITRSGYVSGDMARGTFDTGQSAIFAKQIESVETIFDTLLDDARASIRQLETAEIRP